MYVNKMFEKQPPEGSLSKDDLKNFAKFTEKHLLQSLFFYKIADLQLKTPTQLFSSEF